MEPMETPLDLPLIIALVGRLCSLVLVNGKVQKRRTEQNGTGILIFHTVKMLSSEFKINTFHNVQ